MKQRKDKKLKSFDVFKRGKIDGSLVFVVDNSQADIVPDSQNDIYLRQTAQKALNQKTKRSKIINFVCFIVSILVLVITLVVQNNTVGVHSIEDLEYNKTYLFYAFLIFLAIMLCDSLRTYILVWRSTGKHRPFLSYKSTAICRYYDCITPFSFGGQPFQIYYLSTRGVKGGIASSVPLAKYIYSQVTFCIVSTILLFMGITRKLFGTADTQTIITFSIVTLAICVSFLFGIFFISLSKRITPKIVWGLIQLGHKLKIIKDKEVSYAQSMRTILEYQRSVKYYFKSFVTTTISFILSFGLILLKGLVPYFIYLAFVPEPTVSFLTILILYNACELITMFIPLPGGSGVAELSFTALFSVMFPSTYIFWAMLFFRIFTYYIYILQGIAVNVYDLVIGNRNNDKYLINMHNEEK